MLLRLMRFVARNLKETTGSAMQIRWSTTQPQIGCSAGQSTRRYSPQLLRQGRTPLSSPSLPARPLTVIGAKLQHTPPQVCLWKRRQCNVWNQLFQQSFFFYVLEERLLIGLPKEASWPCWRDTQKPVFVRHSQVTFTERMSEEVHLLL